MGRYPESARKSAVKCVPCNAPVVETVDGEHVCVDCGRVLVEAVDDGRVAAESRTGAPAAGD